jgi:hypothetical protein
LRVRAVRGIVRGIVGAGIVKTKISEGREEDR